MGRRIVAQVSVTIDGYSSGPGGPAHDTWLHEHAFQEQAAAFYEGLWRGIDTALVGRTNYEGYAAVWPGITADPATDRRTRELGQWLARVEKLVVSRTLEHATWENSRIVRDLEAEAKALRESEGSDVLVLNSASVIQSLLRADLLDDLVLQIVPTLVGGGLRLFDGGLPGSTWTLHGTQTFAHGAVALHYRRA
jgi:dihydrofolate reductase